MSLPFAAEKVTTDLVKMNCFPIEIKLKYVAVCITGSFRFGCIKLMKTAIQKRVKSIIFKNLTTQRLEK